MFRVQAVLAVTCTALPKNQDRKRVAFVSNERDEKAQVAFENDEEYTCLMAKI